MPTRRAFLSAATATAALGLVPAHVLADGRKTIVEVPITFDKWGRPLLDLTFATGGPYNFLVDTGAGLPIIRDSVARGLKLEKHGAANTDSLGGESRNAYYGASEVLAGGMFLIPRMEFVGVYDVHSPGIDGALPASFLTSKPTELDFTAGCIRYYLNGAPIDLTGFTRLDAITNNADADGEAAGASKVYVNVVLEGRKMTCLVDTGAAGRLFISPTFATLTGLWDHYSDARESVSVGANGKRVKTRVARAGAFDMGGVSFDAVRITMGDPDAEDTSYGSHDGIIGAGLLSQFTLAFNHGALHVKPNAYFDADAGRDVPLKPFPPQPPVLPAPPAPGK